MSITVLFLKRIFPCYQVDDEIILSYSVYTIQPVVKPTVQPVGQPAASCKRAITVLFAAIETCRLDDACGTSFRQTATR